MRLRDKVVELSPIIKKTVISVFFVFMVTQVIWGGFYAMSKQVSIVDEKGEEIRFITYANNTAEVLAEKNVTLGPWDETSIPLNKGIRHGDVIYIYRSKLVGLEKGKDYSVRFTTKSTVEEFLKSEGIDTEGSVKINVALKEKVTDGMEICVTYIDEKLVEAEEVVPYNTEMVANDNMFVDTTNVIREGSDGLAKRVYREYYENGELISREVVEETVVVAAVDAVEEYGTKPRQNISYGHVDVSRGISYRYVDCIEVTATAYCLKGRTASGMNTQYGVVAVDPRVIPLGTRLYIEAADGTWVYGTAIAADTGGAIKGNIVDLYVETYSEAMNFGRRKAKVYILE